MTTTAPTATITGASRGLGLALARSLADDGWALVLDGRHAADLAEAVDPARGPHARDPRRRRHHRRLPPSRPRHRRPGPRRARPGRVERRHARPVAAPGARRPPARRPAHGPWRRTSSPSSGSCRRCSPSCGLAPPSSPSPRTRRSSPTRAGAPTPRRRPASSSSPPSSVSNDPTSACCASTRATCGPRCTRTRSRVRTSPTARLPEDRVPGLRALIEGPWASGRYQVTDVPAPLEVA